MSRGAGILCIKKETYDELKNGTCTLNEIPVYIGYDENYRSDNLYEMILGKLADDILHRTFCISFKEIGYTQVTKEDSSIRAGMHMLCVLIDKEYVSRSIDAFRVL